MMCHRGCSGATIMRPMFLFRLLLASRRPGLSKAHAQTMAFDETEAATDLIQLDPEEVLDGIEKKRRRSSRGWGHWRWAIE